MMRGLDVPTRSSQKEICENSERLCLIIEDSLLDWLLRKRSLPMFRTRKERQQSNICPEIAGFSRE